MRRNFSKFYGNLPLHSSGQNRGRINRKLLAHKHGLTIKSLFKAYQNWIVIFRFEKSTLTFEQYLNKLQEAGLTPIDIGNTKGKFNLSRYGDIGPYTNDSCRFIPQKNNYLEQRENKHWNPYGYNKRQINGKKTKA